VESTNLARFESPDKAKVVGGWGVDSAPVFPVGAAITLNGETAVQKVSRSGRAERVDDYADVDGELAETLREVGIASAVAAPIKVAGRLWGAVVASSGRAFAFPSDSEELIAGFAELVADALASADAREQLAASRARIVEAADSARRRLERNLHDGAQQRLVALALQLREVEVDRGLGPALEALASRRAVPVRISGIPEARLAPQVEAAVYYLVAEALTNVVKHASATSASVEIARTDQHTRIEVRDAGTGGAAVGEGSGLRGLADRLEALGGSLEVDSRGGACTRVVGRIPVG
jgi:signal transduction histidine kinase